MRITEIPEIDPKRIAIIGAKGPRNLPEWTPLAKELGIRVMGIREVEKRGIEAATEEALSIAAPDGRPPYVSVDIDAIDPAYAPATNSIEAGGFTSREIITGVRLACEQGFSGFDVVEVSPDYDSKSGTTSMLAARLAAEALACLAAKKAGKVRSWEWRG